MSVAAQWTNDSAFNLQLAQDEAQHWIEAVTGEKFSGNFQQSLKDGRLLCKLINQIKPGSVKKINSQKTSYAEMENISFYSAGAKNLGLKETQLFTSKELYEDNGRMRDVVISLYWLGRAARGVPTNKGPQLNLNAFHSQKMKCSKCKHAINDNNYLATMDQQWHKECATCCKCKCALDPHQPFYQAGNDIYCHNCMVASTSGPSGSSTTTGKPHGHSHGGDSKCGNCKTPLDGKDHVHGENGQDFCTNCICGLCNNPVTPANQIVKNGKKFCKDCVCSDCTAPFNPDEGFYEVNGKNVCPKCHDKKNKGPTTSSTTSKAAPHDHSGHGHNKGPASSPSNLGKSNDNNNNKNGCKSCNKPKDPKKHKHPGKDSEKYCDPCENDYCCGTCHNEINGPAIGALGKKFHPDCFNCVNCSINIPTKAQGKFQNKDGQPLCNPCFDKSGNKFGFCAGCGDKVDRNGIEALGQKWHPKCFNCVKCHKDFPNGTYVEHDNLPYCKGCAPSETPEDCYGCKKPLSGSVAEVQGKFWHQGCFKCNRCKKGLVTGYTAYEGLPYCEPCYLEIAGDRCEGCKKPMVGKAVKAKGKEYHVACFKCSTCSKALAGTNESPDVFIKFGKPYCRTCNPPSNSPTISSGSTTTKSTKRFCSGCGAAHSGGRFCSECGAVF